jgi:hypothetical protein
MGGISCAIITLALNTMSISSNIENNFFMFILFFIND